MTEVTYLGYVYGTLAALRADAAARPRASIVQVGSALAYRGIPLQAAYCGAKHAIQGFTDSLRCELIHDRSRVRRHDGADAGAEHAAVRAGCADAAAHEPQPVPPIFQPEVAAARSSARPSTRAASSGSAADRRGDPRQPAGPGPARPLPRPHRLSRPSRPPSRPTRAGRDNLWEPRARRPRRPRRLRRRAHKPRSLQAWLSAHRRALVDAGPRPLAGALALAARAHASLIRGDGAGGIVDRNGARGGLRAPAGIRGDR